MRKNKRSNKTIFLIILPIILLQTLFAVTNNLDQASNFRGTKGNFVDFITSKNITDSPVIILDAKINSDGIAHYYYTTLPDGNNVYFLVVKSPDGKIRAAANGCQICGRAMQGFQQSDDLLICNTCGNRYPLNKIATEKGGCNPAPINPDLKIKNGSLIITFAELNKIEKYFSY